MEKVLIIRREQFGYHTDIFKWCENLRQKYQVTSISFDYEKPKVSLEGVKTKYVSLWGSRAIRGIHFLMVSCWHILFNKGAVIVSYFPGCHLIKKALPWRKMILDVRTMDVSADQHNRERANKKIVAAANIFDFCTPISEGVAEQLHVERSKISILPLGADSVAKKDKSFDSIRLLYIGTFFNRNLEKTLYGLSQALNIIKGKVNIHYDIVGDGKNGELDLLKGVVKDLSLDEYVTFHGFIRHDLLTDFFEKCNVGVSFVPQTPYFEYQPVTKTFEYALSGLYTIGTSTYCNKEVICKKNGILIQDNPDSFADAIIQISNSLDTMRSDIIKETLKDFRWDKIVERALIPVIENSIRE